MQIQSGEAIVLLGSKGVNGEVIVGIILARRWRGIELKATALLVT